MMKGVWVGKTTDWQKEFAVHNFFGQKIEDVALEDIDAVLGQWEMIRNVHRDDPQTAAA